MGRMAQVPFGRVARAYRSLGVPTIPLCPPDHRGASDSHVLKCQTPGKTPLIKGWQRYCSTVPTERELDSWAVTWPYANVGGPTGPLLGIGLDVDPRHGGDIALDAYLHKHGVTIPKTWTSFTGGGGVHYMFAWPQGQRIRNAGKDGLLTGVDLRGDGGCLVLPPSQHLSGRAYCWEPSMHPSNTHRAPCPAWLLALIGSKEGQRQPPGPTIAPAFGPVLEGSRNAHLTSLAGTLRRRGCDAAVILAALHAENEHRCEPPLPAAEVERIARSVSRYAPTSPPPMGHSPRRIWSFTVEVPR